MKFSNFSFPIFLASTLATTTSGFQWNPCGLDSDIFQPLGVAISPDPPKSGEPANITIKGILSEPIEDGSSVQITVKLGLIKIYNKNIDICGDFLDGTGISCPIPPGDLSITKTYNLEFPPAKLTTHVEAYNADDADISCLDLKLEKAGRFDLRSNEES
ncbi:uncharacterized protein N7503_004030 [Penicillium pulvis]|uniref:uncharacterized protein n=1 Tax=Penicillium pulvis TaxID=1562058 RepID=UPI002549109F|nr:uncharacterized protein N7503_004030 [Penicillium pulvis]KAJ5806428.1 hypothetical protein N7503_004030 [Penicillium pulvis]